MNNFIVSLAGNMGGGGFGGGTEVDLPSLPVGDGVPFDFELIFNALKKFVSGFGSLFDLMFSPLYTWLDYVFSWFGLSDKYTQQVIENVSEMKLFQMTFFDFVTYAIPVVLCVILLLWVFKFKNTSLIGPL